MPAAIHKRKLTDKDLQRLKPAPAGKRYMVWDTHTRNLAVKVTDRGTITFIVVGRRKGQAAPQYHRLGRYPDQISLREAREQVSDVMRLYRQGTTPKEQEKRKSIERAKARGEAFEVAANAFFEFERGKKLRTAHSTEGVMRRGFLGQTPHYTRTPKGWQVEWKDDKDAVWRDRPVLEINKREIIERLDQIKKQRGKYAARHALAVVRKFFNWCAEGDRYGVAISPATSIKDKTLGITGKDLQRKRVLNDAELRSVWEAAKTMGYPFGPLTQVLMLTGQRLNDWALARHHEIDWETGMLVVPPERYKTELAHEIPLTPYAVEILRGLPTFSGNDALLFSSSFGKRPITGISPNKSRLDAIIAEQRKQAGLGVMPHWVTHDLRRTVRTRLGELGIEDFVCEQVIGHAMPGLRKVYDQGRYRIQKRHALETWEKRLLSIVGETPSPREGPAQGAGSPDTFATTSPT